MEVDAFGNFELDPSLSRSQALCKGFEEKQQKGGQEDGKQKLIAIQGTSSSTSDVVTGITERRTK